MEGVKNQMFYGFNKIPASYDYQNVYNSNFKPSTVHVKNTGLTNYFTRWLLQKALSRIKCDNLPDTWASNYFYYCIFVFGYIAIIKTRTYGVIPQHCTLTGYNVMYQPNKAIIANPLLKGSLEPIIDKECALIKLSPDYGGIWDLVSHYAELMALTTESYGVNLVNSKFAYMFFGNNKNQLESFKKAIDQILSGNPAAFLDKDLLDEDGNMQWEVLNQRVKDVYIGSELLEDLEKIEARFNTKIGIPNVNIAKQSGVSPDEVHSNDIDTYSLPNLWLDELNKGAKKANELFGLNLKFKLREMGVDDIGNNFDTGNL